MINSSDGAILFISKNALDPKSPINTEEIPLLIKRNNDPEDKFEFLIPPQVVSKSKRGGGFAALRALDNKGIAESLGPFLERLLGKLRPLRLPQALPKESGGMGVKTNILKIKVRFYLYVNPNNPFFMHTRSQNNSGTIHRSPGKTIHISSTKQSSSMFHPDIVIQCSFISPPHNLP